MKIVIGMSGGIDSSVASILLKKMNHSVAGLTFNLFGGDDARRNIDDAKLVAGMFDFPHYVLDIEKEFRNEVISPFCKEYLEGRTPNPCIRCNPGIKFRRLLGFADEHGYDMIATGHYAAVKKDENGRYYIAMNSDPAKDQSYFLSFLTQDILSKIIFPLQGYTKNEIKKIAAELNLPVTEKPESQEICFISGDSYSGFIEKTVGFSPPGDIIDSSEKIIGRHGGIHRYTIGQRRGLGISNPKPLYVISIDSTGNKIVAGPRHELEMSGLVAASINHMKETNLDGKRVLTKIRSTQPLMKATLEEKRNYVCVSFDTPQAGITPGQAVVFYNDESEILGAGIIQEGIK